MDGQNSFKLHIPIVQTNILKVDKSHLNGVFVCIKKFNSCFNYKYKVFSFLKEFKSL